MLDHGAYHLVGQLELQVPRGMLRPTQQAAQRGFGDHTRCERPDLQVTNGTAKR
jgi:hypothetical protein